MIFLNIIAPDTLYNLNSPVVQVRTVPGKRRSSWKGPTSVGLRSRSIINASDPGLGLDRGTFRTNAVVSTTGLDSTAHWLDQNRVAAETPPIYVRIGAD